MLRGSAVIGSNDRGRSLRRFENVGSVIAMAYQGDFASDFWACWQALRAKLERQREDQSSKQSVPHTPGGMNKKKSDAKERRGSLVRLPQLCRLNACASAEIDSKSLQLITNHHCK